MRQVKTEEIDAEEVIIRTKEGELVVQNPKVMKMSIMGQDTLQVSGKLSKRERGVSDEDIEMVAAQTGADRDAARAALEKHRDLAKAILELKG